ARDQSPEVTPNAPLAGDGGRGARSALAGRSGGRLDPGGRRREDLGFGGSPAQVPQPQAGQDQEQARGRGRAECTPAAVSAPDGRGGATLVPTIAAAIGGGTTV